MKRKIVYLIVIVTLVNLTALGTMIYQRRVAPDRSSRTVMQESRVEQVNRELALTPEQLIRFEVIRTQFHSRVDSLNQTLEGIKGQLLQEIWQPQPNDSRIDSLLTQISQLQMESQRRVIRHFYQFKEALTLEQWQKFYEIVSERFPTRVRVCGSERSVQAEENNQ